MLGVHALSKVAGDTYGSNGRELFTTQRASYAVNSHHGAVRSKDKEKHRDQCAHVADN